MKLAMTLIKPGFVIARVLGARQSDGIRCCVVDQYGTCPQVHCTTHRQAWRYSINECLGSGAYWPETCGVNPVFSKRVFSTPFFYITSWHCLASRRKKKVCSRVEEQNLIPYHHHDSSLIDQFMF